MRICTVTGNKEKGVKIMPRPYLGDPKYTIEVLQKYNFAFQKRFGQNFLIDTHVLDKIIDSAQITKDDFVLEIGPGIGTMTQYLAEAAREVAAVESRHPPACTGKKSGASDQGCCQSAILHYYPDHHGIV